MATRKDKAFLQENSRPTIDELTNEQYAKAGLQPQGLGLNEAARAESIKDTEAQLERQYREELRVQQIQAQQAATIRTQTQAAPSLGKVVATTRKSDIFWIFSIHLWLFSTVQLPIAAASLIFLGLAAGLETTWIGRRVSEAGSAANAVTSFVGFDFSAFSPESLFFILHTLLYGLMIFIILSTVGYYFMSGQRPLSGRKASLKMGLLLICFIGYAIPIANLFPWIVLYMVAVWRYPR